MDVMRAPYAPLRHVATDAPACMHGEARSGKRLTRFRAAPHVCPPTHPMVPPILAKGDQFLLYKRYRRFLVYPLSTASRLVGPVICTLKFSFMSILVGVAIYTTRRKPLTLKVSVGRGVRTCG